MNGNRYEIKNTIGMFDLFKGFVMISMLLAHTQGIFDFFLQYESMGAFVKDYTVIPLILLAFFGVFCNVSMPALFIISGYGFRKAPNKKCILKQVNSLLIPYFIAMVITAIVHLFAYWALYDGLKGSIKRTIHIFAGGLFGFARPVSYFGFDFLACGPIWFLLSLGIALIIFNLLAQHFDGNKLLLASAIVSVLGWVISLFVSLPYSISQGMIATLYIGMGYWIKKNKAFLSSNKISKKAYIITIIVAVALEVLAMSSLTGFNMSNEIYAYGYISILSNGLCGALMIRLLLPLNRFDGAISNFFRKLGRYSLYLMCIHSIELVAVGGYLGYDFYTNHPGNIGAKFLTMFAVRVLVNIPLTFIYAWLKNKGKFDYSKYIKF